MLSAERSIARGLMLGLSRVTISSAPLGRAAANTAPASGGPTAGNRPPSPRERQMKQLYQVLNMDGSAYHVGASYPSIPRVGEWMPEITGDFRHDLGRAYHLYPQSGLARWLGPTIWEAEASEPITAPDGRVFAQNFRLVRRCERWDEATARLFAADCAESVLHYYEGMAPVAVRAKDAIAAARAIARGEIDPVAAEGEQVCAARSAGRALARGANLARRANLDKDRAPLFLAASDAATAAAWAATTDAFEAAASASQWARSATNRFGGGEESQHAWQSARLVAYLEGSA